MRFPVMTSLASIAAAILLMPLAAPHTAEPELDRYGELLAKYVTPRGVRYAAWRAAPADVQALSSVVETFSGTNTKSISNAERHALMINLYNARILEIVLKQNPKSSIKEVTPGITGFGVFTKPAVRLDGKLISLRDLEDRLRKDSKDPRIHFAINCASKSCPPIAPGPYRSRTLDEQLDGSTRAFLASSGALVVSRDGSADKPQVRIQASKIFDWYGKDFEPAGGEIAFIQKHGPADVASAIKEAAGRVKLDYQDYDWSLNEAP